MLTQLASQEIETTIPFVSSSAFSGIGLDEDIVKLLTKNGISTPTSIQERAIPVALEGRDLVGIAQTGTGKTLAFVLPIIQRLKRTHGQALIVVPTRELALQVEQAVRSAAPLLKPKMTTAVIIGGAPMQLQRDRLARKPKIIVATPGRLQDHLDRGWADLSKVSTVVLDEADRMFDMGFAPQITKFLEILPEDRQTKLFSATMPEVIAKLANRHLKDPVRVEVAAPTLSAAKIHQEVCFVERDKKARLLEKLVTATDGLVIVFCRTKGDVSDVAYRLQEMGHEATEIHSSRSQSQRKRALEAFRSGRSRILVATDVAARGIDVDDVQLVINYDLPDAPEDYIHRIGRTGRAGRSGRAISFATPAQSFKVKVIERLTKCPLLLSEFSLARPERSAAPRAGGSSRGGSSFRGGSSRGSFRGGSSRGGEGRRDDRGTSSRGPRTSFSRVASSEERPRRARTTDAPRDSYASSDYRPSRQSSDRSFGESRPFRDARSSDDSRGNARGERRGSTGGWSGGRSSGRSRDGARSDFTFKGGRSRAR